MPLSALKQIIVPQEGLFFEKLREQAATVHAGAQALSGLMHDYRKVGEKARNIKALEHAGDEITHDIYTQLNKSFIVPFDHSDISDLATALDNILDMTNITAKHLAVYEIAKPSDSMVHLSDLLLKQTGELKAAIAALDKPGTFSSASQACVEIHRLENEADEIHTKAVSALFKKKDAVEIIKQKDILDSLELATDKVERAAVVVSDIIMKHS